VPDPSAPVDPSAYAPQSFAPGLLLDPQNQALINAGAAQIVGASMRNNAGLPDPQLAVSALDVGAAPDLSAAFSDPAYSKLLSGTHPGQRYTMARDVPPAGDDVFTMSQHNWGAYWDRVRKADGADAQFKSLGFVPVANVGWLNAVKGSDPGSVRRWQAFLNHTGFSGKADLEVSGTVSLPGRELVLSGARGGQAHLWGSKHANRWAEYPSRCARA